MFTLYYIWPSNYKVTADKYTVIYTIIHTNTMTYTWCDIQIDFCGLGSLDDFMVYYIYGIPTLVT